MSRLELIVIILSAGLVGIGAAEFMQQNLGAAFMCVGASLKMLAGLGRMPVIDFEKLMNAKTVEEIDSVLEEQKAKNEEKKPWLRWISEFSTYLFLGGFFIFLVDSF